MKMVALILSIGITTNPANDQVSAHLAKVSAHAKRNERRDTTSLSPSYAIQSSGYGKAVNVDELLWIKGANTALKKILVNQEQPIENLVCFFHVRPNGNVIAPVTFSRALEPDESIRISQLILQCSLPRLRTKNSKKVYFEIAKDGDTCVGFAK